MGEAGPALTPEVVARMRIEYMDLDALRKHPRNAKLHDVEEIDRSMARFGFVAPPVIDEGTGLLAAGHGRLETLARRRAEGLPPPERVVLHSGAWLIPVVRGISFKNDDELRAYLIADNRLTELGGWDDAKLVAELQAQAARGEEFLAGVGYDVGTLEALEEAARYGHGGGPPPGAGSLSEKFLVPPFSVLNAREGWWQERKRWWISLGIQSELGRIAPIGGSPLPLARLKNAEGKIASAGFKGAIPVNLDTRSRAAPGGSMMPVVKDGKIVRGDLHARSASAFNQTRPREIDMLRRTGDFAAPGGSPRPAMKTRDGHTVRGDGHGQPLDEEQPTTGTSIFDPVLCELIYRWFCPSGGAILDPFAGGSVRGIVAGVLGRSYAGIELRQEQIEANRVQAAKILKDASLVAKPAAPRAPAADLEPVADGELTPLQVVEYAGGKVTLKRDDLYSVAGARGGKARALKAMIQGKAGVCTAGNRHSPMLSRVARVAWECGVPSRGYASGTKEMNEIERDAAAFGMELVKEPNVNYLQTLVGRARKDAEARGWVFAPLGVEGPEYFECTRAQVANVPKDTKRLVVTVGSGMSLAAILSGLQERGLKIPVLGVQVGFDPSELLDRWAPQGWRELVQFVKPARSFEVAEEVASLGGVELDPHFEAKVLPFLQPDDLFWVIAIRSAGIGPESLPAEASAAPRAPQPAAAPADAGPAWAKGYALAALEEVAELFEEHDAPYVLGAYTGVKETNVADWLEKGQLRVLGDGSGKPVVALVVQEVAQKGKIVDFADTTVAELRPGDLKISRCAARRGCELLLVPALQAAVGDKPRASFLEIWQEDPGMRAAAEAAGFAFLSSKIRASSEVVGIWQRGARGALSRTERDEWTLRRLSLEIDPAAAAAEVQAAGLDFAQHYSSYNKGGAWTALALQSYGGDPTFIEKPAEMSKKWRADNPEKLQWELQETPLAARLPAVCELAAKIPGRKHRVRLMKLGPGGGELTRHADITDPDAGTAPGKLMRIHVPLATNAGVIFEQWSARGDRLAANMALGSVWYLDTRKAHRARNGGETARVHLVMDVESSPELLQLLAGGAEGEVQPEPTGFCVPGELLAARTQPAQVPVGELQPIFYKAECRPAAPAAPAAPAVPAAARPRAGEARGPVWYCGDSRAAGELLPAGEEYDLVFSCPPYADLERYSDDPRDLSTMDYADFRAALRQIVLEATKRLRHNRFACFVVGDVRDEEGKYRGLVGHTVEAFEAAGLQLYNDAVLLTAVGSLPIRAGRVFSASRKLGKTHQNVLVFVKGDPAEATAACGQVEVLEEALPAPEEDALAGAAGPPS